MSVSPIPIVELADARYRGKPCGRQEKGAPRHLIHGRERPPKQACENGRGTPPILPLPLQRSGPWIYNPHTLPLGSDEETGIISHERTIGGKIPSKVAKPHFRNLPLRKSCSRSHRPVAGHVGLLSHGTISKYWTSILDSVM